MGRVLPVLVLAALLPFAGAARAGDAPLEEKFDNAAYPKEFRDRVQHAITRGMNWLLLRQRDDGSWASPHGSGYPIGPTALAALALLKSGLPAGHPKVERAFRFLRGKPLVRTYEVAVVLMAIDARYDPAPDPFAKEEVDRYGERVVPEPCADRISKEDLAWMKEGMDFLVSSQTAGTWRYPAGGYDLSNTQYALLGLKAADRCGLRVPEKVWKDALDAILGHQERDGSPVAMRVNEVRGDYRVEWTEKARARGFRYVPSPTMPVSGSMTTAGAAGMMICQGMLWKSRKFTADERQRTRDAVRDALAWMQENFTVESNPGMGIGHHYYYLYGLERMGVLGHLRFLGRRDWYLEGAEHLLAAQDDLGSWVSGDVVDTCFALLFLKRASFRTSHPVLTQPSGAKPVVPPAGGGR